MITPEQREALIAANIPMVYHDVLFSTIEGGSSLRDYVVGETYTYDRQNNQGMCLYGNASKRVRLFPVLARAMVIARDNVLFIPLIVLKEIVCGDNHPLMDSALSCSALFVSNFCTPEEPFSLATADRAPIEDFLVSRCHTKQRNYYSAREPLERLTWWTDDFRNEQQQYMKDYSTDAM